MDTPMQRKRQLQVDEKQRKKQANRRQSVAVEVRIPLLPSRDARISPDSLDSFLSHYDADPRLQKVKQRKVLSPNDTNSDRDAAPSTIPQCQLCQRVARALHPDSGYRVPKYYDSTGHRTVKLGSWEELLRNQDCPMCLGLAGHFSVDFQGGGSWPRSWEYEYWLSDYSSTNLQLFLESVSKVGPSSTLENSISIRPLARGTSEAVGVLIDQWIDVERVLQWIKNCDTMHAECHWKISASSASFSNHNTYLISVSRQCLVKAIGGEKYVALSYVWGAGFSQFRTTKANLTLLQSEGSLYRKGTRDHLPGTIQRAMHLTSLLGVDFLWVDCLCIVQDDPIHAASQINSMASIYSNSYLTLCAADGIDSESGLLGIPQCSAPRTVHQGVLVFADGPTSSEWVKDMPPKVSIYDERGWTFQEQLLSRRILSFTGNGLEWRCAETFAKEQTLEVTQFANTIVDSNIVRADTLWPCLKKFDSLLSSYLKRRLTYEEDILRAFSDILESLSSSMLGGFFFGLPQQFFDAALLWIPEKNLTQRVDLRSGKMKTPLPSWSWAGWKGARKSQIDPFGLCHERSNHVSGYTRRQRLVDIYPCVTWFKINMDTLEKVKISNDYARFRNDGLLGTITLPLGWSSYHDEKDGHYYYMYDNAPRTYTFWYPIPTLRGTEPASDRQWGPILYFKTWRGYLEVGSPLPQDEEYSEALPINSLYTSEGAWAGIVYVHHSPESEQKQQCELVLISGGWSLEKNFGQSSWLPESHHEERPRSGEFYHFYHVLWIERHWNIAYRRGLGRLVKKVWDDLPKDEVEIFLG